VIGIDFKDNFFLKRNSRRDLHNKILIDWLYVACILMEKLILWMCKFFFIWGKLSPMNGYTYFTGIPT
jgi:hypothetical protein